MKRSIFLFVLLVSLVQTAQGQDHLVVPVAANLAGANGTYFRTDLTIRNRREVSQEVSITFLPADQDNFSDFEYPPTISKTLQANETVTFEDIVGEGFQSERMGAIEILGLRRHKPDSEARLAAAYRIYTPGPGGVGTMSQASSAIDFSAGATSVGTVAVVAGLRQDTDFRTNVGVFSEDPYHPRTFRVTATGETGVSTMLLTVQPGSMTQLPLPSGNLGRMSIKFELLDDPIQDPDYPVAWVGYASTIDNRTGDSWIQNAVPFSTPDHHPAAALILPAGDVNGANGTHFRTDLDVTNHRDVEEKVRIGFYTAPFLYGDPVHEDEVTIPPLSTLTFSNVTGNLLQTPGVLGSVIINTLDWGSSFFNADARLTAAYRIWTPSPATSEGSMSQASEAVDLEALPAGNRERVAIGVRLDSGFRCNVGIASDTYYARKFRITASSASGSVTTTVVADGFQLTQVTLPAADLGYATVTITPLDANADDRWTAYASSVDNRSGDSWLQNASPR